VQAALGNSASVVANRMMNISTPEIETDTPDIQAKRTTGGAAGTLAEQDEIWFSGFASNATQKLRAGDAGYKATTMGGAVGYDLNVNDDLILGAALTYSDTGIDQADHKTGDKVEAQTYMLGFYGLYDLTEHIFIQGLLNIGRTTVATDSNRVIYGRNYVAHGEYDIANYGFAVVTGYNYAYGHYLFTPTIGLQQNLFSEDGYTETGAGSQNLKVLVKNYNKFTGNIGLKVSTPVQIDQYRLTPSFNFALNHDFNNEGVKVKQMFVGTTNIITTESAKPATTSYTAGAGLSLKVSNVDIDVNYNIEVKSKFVGHQGSFKLRINL
jgi:outer membrane lipase/esterase